MEQKLPYPTSGPCSRLIELTAEDGRLTDVRFVGGCDGNLKGIRQLVVGMKLEDVRQKLQGIRCGSKPTSCPDQLSRAVDQLLRG